MVNISDRAYVNLSLNRIVAVNLVPLTLCLHYSNLHTYIYIYIYIYTHTSWSIQSMTGLKGFYEHQLLNSDRKMSLTGCVSYVSGKTGYSPVS